MTIKERVLEKLEKKEDMFFYGFSMRKTREVIALTLQEVMKEIQVFRKNLTKTYNFVDNLLDEYTDSNGLIDVDNETVPIIKVIQIEELLQNLKEKLKRMDEE